MIPRGSRGGGTGNRDQAQGGPSENGRSVLPPCDGLRVPWSPSIVKEVVCSRLPPVTALEQARSLGAFRPRMAWAVSPSTPWALQVPVFFTRLDPLKFNDNNERRPDESGTSRNRLKPNSPCARSACLRCRGNYQGAEGQRSALGPTSTLCPSIETSLATVLFEPPRRI